MTIQLSKDAENAINAAVLSGRFASAHEMVNQLIRDYAQSHSVLPSVRPNEDNGGADTPDPLLGLMLDDAPLMDEIVADAYRHRREEQWREIDL